MAEYIERQAALDAFNRAVQDVGILDADDIEIVFGMLSSADVVPVVHGRWIKYTGMGKVQWMCSECSAEEKNPKVANYCYHCGAKMEEDNG